jgi:hypothetical protein
MDARKVVKMENKSVIEYMAALDEYATTEFHTRMELIERELLEIEDGRFDAIVSVSKGRPSPPCSLLKSKRPPDDQDSIRTLTDVTARCFDHEKVRMLYIASQITRIDLKIDLAVAETMHIYRHALRHTAAAGALPGGASAHRIAVAALVCRAVVGCFGVPTVSARTVQQIVKAVVWDDVGSSLPLIFVEAVATVGFLGTVVLAGMPVFLASGAVNAPIAIPATTRLVLMLAADVILILTEAFKRSTGKFIGHPLAKDIEDAATAYREEAKAVHDKIARIVPMTNFVKSLRFNKVKLKFEKIVQEHKMVSEDISQTVKSLDISDESDSEESEACEQA